MTRAAAVIATGLLLLPACAGGLRDDLADHPNGGFAEAALGSAAGDAIDAVDAPVVVPAPGPVTPAELLGAGVSVAEAELTALGDPGWRPEGKLSWSTARSAFLARSRDLEAAAQALRAARTRFGQVAWLDALVRQYDGFAGKSRLDFPLRGAPALQGEIVATDVALAEVRFERATLAGLLSLTERWYGAYYWQRAVSILTQTVELAERVASAAGARYRSGRTSHANLIQAEIRLEDLRQKLRTARAQRVATRLALGAALDLPADVAEDMSLTLDVSLPDRPGRDDTRARALERGPAPAAARHRAHMAELMLQLAERRGLPDLRREDGAAQPGDLRFAVAGPFVDELRLRTVERRAKLAQAERDVVAAADAAWARLDEALRERYSTVLEQQERAALAVDVAERGYSAGTATFFDLDAAVQLYLQISLRARAAQRDAFVAAARLDLVTGLPPGDAAEEER